MIPPAFRALPEDVQEEMIAFFTDVCPDCGNLRSVCSDEALAGEWYPQRNICYAQAAKEVTWRRVRATLKQPSFDDPKPHLTDGWSIWASQYDLTPDDDFEGALPLSGQQTLGDEHQAGDGHPDPGESQHL